MQARPLKRNDLFVVTESVEREERASWYGIEGTIRFVPLWKWLTRDCR